MRSSSSTAPICQSYLTTRFKSKSSDDRDGEDDPT